MLAFRRGVRRKERRREVLRPSLGRHMHLRRIYTTVGHPRGSVSKTTHLFWLYPDFPKSTNTLYLYILRAKLSVRPAQVDGIYVNIISHGSTPARTRACSDTTPRPDALYRALSRLDAVSDQAHVNVTHCQI